MRTDTREIQGTADSPPFTIQEITAIVKILNTKAPEHDLIEVKMVKEAWQEIQLEFLEMLNGCLTQMVFPRQHKKAQIRVLLKGDNKDKTDPKSYRPIHCFRLLVKSWREQ